MRMSPHDRGVNEQIGGALALLCLQALPELLPGATDFPASEAIVDRIPFTEVLWQITPGVPVRAL